MACLRRAVWVGCVLGGVGVGAVWGQAAAASGSTTASPNGGPAAPEEATRAQQNNDLEILSDTQGVDFRPYLRDVLATVYKAWAHDLPAEARPPSLIKGITVLRFTIARDGTLTAMHLDGSTHTDSLNRAAWGAVSGVGQFPPLPAGFTGPNLQIRVYFRVNEPQQHGAASVGSGVR